MSCKVDGHYDEDSDSTQATSKAIAEAKVEKLPIVIIFGACWYPNCRRLSETIDRGKNANLIAKDFKVVKANVGNFNTNLEIANIYGNPISGGIPGAAILSFDGKLVHVTKPGELSNARAQSGEGMYSFFDKSAKN